MDSLQNIKSRLKTVKNIGQITKAMEAVSATKMRRSQEIALNSRPYAFKALDLLEKLSRFSPLETELSKHRPVENTLLVVIASDKGLAGSFNTQIFRAAENFLKTDSLLDSPEHNLFCLAVGKKAEQFLSKKKMEIVYKFYGFGDFIDPKEIKPLADFMTKGFIDRKWDRVVTVSMNFKTALKQEPLSQQVLPVDFEKISEMVKQIVPEYGKYAQAEKAAEKRTVEENIDYLFEPSPKESLEILIPHLIEMQIYHLVLEANASEHSARRLAMKNASDNSEELADDFTLQYNKVRQANITREMVEISSTQNAL